MDRDADTRIRWGARAAGLLAVLLAACGGRSDDDARVATAPNSCASECDGGQPEDGGVCVASTKSCDGKVLRTCGPDRQWASSPCPYLCADGACQGVCTPGAIGCNSNVPQTCDATGTWTGGATCANVCDGGRCTDGCEPLTQQCKGRVPRICSGLRIWASGAECPYACTAGKCIGLCVPNATRCVGDTVEHCDDTGQWGDAITCAAAAPVCNAGTCTCPSVDIQTDLHNCGTCGHDCQGGQCSAGHCQPVELLVSTDDIGALAIDATYVYWTGWLLGDVSKIPKEGGSTTVIATGPDHAVALAIDATNAYWDNYSTRDIRQVPIVGGAVTQVIPPMSGYSARLAVDAHNVYWSSFNSATGELNATPIGGGATKVIANNGAGGIATDGIHVYYTPYLGGGLRRVGVAGGADVLLAAPNDAASRVVLDSTHAFYGSANNLAGGVLAVPKAGGAVTRLTAASVGFDYGGSMAVDDVDVYWSNTKKVQKVAIKGGPVELVASGPAYDLVVDAKYIFWSTGKTIVRLAK